MASFSITTDNEAVLDFWKADLKLVSEESGARLRSSITTRKAGMISADIRFRQEMGRKAFGATEDMPDMFQMVVDEGVVKAWSREALP